MDGQVNAGTLVGAIPKVAIVGWLKKRLPQLGEVLATVADETLTPDIGPEDAHRFECSVEEHAREFSRSFQDQCFNWLEPEKVESMPEKIQHLGQTSATQEKSKQRTGRTHFDTCMWMEKE